MVPVNLSWIFVLTVLHLSQLGHSEEHSKWLKPHYDGVEIVYPRVNQHERTKRFARIDEYAEERVTQVQPSETPGTPTSPLVIVIRGDNKTFFFDLHPVDDLVSPNFTVSESFGSGSNESRRTRPRIKGCLFRGKVISHMPGVASFSMCNEDETMYGRWITKDGHYVLRPVLSDSNGTDLSGHMLYKMKNSKNENQTDETFCSAPLKIPLGEPSDNYTTSGRVRRAAFASKVIETAVFADSALNTKFSNKYKGNSFQKLTDYIMAVVNEVQLIYDFDSMETKFKLVLVRLEVLKPPTAARFSGKTNKMMRGQNQKKGQKKALQSNGGNSQNAPNTGGGDIDKYLDNFCAWQAKKDPPEGKQGHWDHSIMLTGLNLYKSYGNKKNDKVLGQAWLDGMCIPKYSCTINEGDDFEAAYVISHEMGHNLGMPHDGDGNKCDSNKFIMSPVTGAGKITWSTCSNKALVKFLKKPQVKTCLSDDARPPSNLDYDKSGKLPGQLYPPDAQCKYSMGKNYLAYIPNKKPYSNICRELWCIQGMTATTTHPALDGSSCDNGKMCRQGKCS